MSDVSQRLHAEGQSSFVLYILIALQFCRPEKYSFGFSKEWISKLPRCLHSLSFVLTLVVRRYSFSFRTS